MKVCRQLDALVSGRKQFHEYRTASAVDPGRVHQPETLLQADPQDRCFRPLAVFQRNPASGRNRDMRRGEPLGRLLLVIGQHPPQNMAHVDSPEFCGGRCSAGIERQPLRCPFQDSVCPEIRKIQFRVPGGQGSHPTLQVFHVVRKIQHGASFLAGGFAENRRDLFPDVFRYRTGGEDKSSDAGFPSGRDSALAGVPCHGVALLRPPCEIARIHRRGQENASRGAFPGVKVRNGDPFRGRERVVFIHFGAVSACQLETPVSFLPRFGNPFRVRSSDKDTRFVGIDGAVVRSGPEQCPVLFRDFQDAAPTALFGAPSGIPEGVQAPVQAGISFLGKRILFLQQGGEVACKCFLGRRFRFNEHPGDTRMAGQRGEAFPPGSDLSIGIEGAKGTEQVPGLGEPDGGWRGEPGEPLRTGFSPGGDLQHGRCQVGFFDFRFPGRSHPLFRPQAPQAVTDPFRQTSGPSGTLVCHVFADADRFQVAEPALRIENQVPEQARIHDSADSFDGKGGFRDRCGEYDFPFSGRAGGDGFPLFLVGQEAVQGAHPCPFPQRAVEPFAAAADVRLSGQESEDVPFLVPMCLTDVFDS